MLCVFIFGGKFTHVVVFILSLPLFLRSFHTAWLFLFWNGFTPICNCLFSFFYDDMFIFSCCNAIHMYNPPNLPLSPPKFLLEKLSTTTLTTSANYLFCFAIDTHENMDWQHRFLPRFPCFCCSPVRIHPNAPTRTHPYPLGTVCAPFGFFGKSMMFGELFPIEPSS